MQFVCLIEIEAKQLSAILTGPQRKKKTESCCENDMWLFLSISSATWKCKFFFLYVLSTRENTTVGRETEKKKLFYLCIRHWRYPLCNITMLSKSRLNLP